MRLKEKLNSIAKHNADFIINTSEEDVEKMKQSFNLTAFNKRMNPNTAVNLAISQEVELRNKQIKHSHGK